MSTQRNSKMDSSSRGVGWGGVTVVFAEVVEDEEGVGPREGHHLAEHVLVDKWDRVPPLVLLVHSSHFLQRP